MLDTPAASTTPHRISLAHDWLCGFRGGEAVLERLALLFEQENEPTRLYAMFDSGVPLAPAIDRTERRVPRIGRFRPFAGPMRRWLLPAYPSLVGSLTVMLGRDHRARPIDLLISTSSAAIKGMRAPEGVPHLCYCHSPARYIWERRADYGGSPLRSIGLRCAGPAFKSWDRSSATNVSRFVANSHEVARRIRAHFDLDATVVHPPVDTEFFTPSDEADRGHWLVVAALEPYKQIDLAIEAAHLADRELVIVGTGSERARLESIARNVRFAGRVGPNELRKLYRTASALLFPQVEDFGIAAAEALACGCPVVARRAGGALDIIQEGTTGAFFGGPERARDDAAALAEAAASVTRDPLACRTRAELFSVDRFDNAMRRHALDLL
ncbi:MAG: glycosyltransferase [Planctomycetota bacterium]